MVWARVDGRHLATPRPPLPIRRPDREGAVNKGKDGETRSQEEPGWKGAYRRREAEYAEGPRVRKLRRAAQRFREDLRSASRKLGKPFDRPDTILGKLSSLGCHEEALVTRLAAIGEAYRLGEERHGSLKRQDRARELFGVGAAEMLKLEHELRRLAADLRRLNSSQIPGRLERDGPEGDYRDLEMLSRLPTLMEKRAEMIRTQCLHSLPRWSPKESRPRITTRAWRAFVDYARLSRRNPRRDRTAVQWRDLAFLFELVYEVALQKKSSRGRGRPSFSPKVVEKRVRRFKAMAPLDVRILAITFLEGSISRRGS